MTAWEIFVDVALSLVPPILVGGVFYVIMRSILRADSKEREVYSQIEAEERAKLETAAVKPAVKKVSTKPSK